MSKAIVVYLSTSGNTKMMADSITEGIIERHVDAEAISFYDSKTQDIKSADAIAVGSSTFFYKMLPPMEKFLDETMANAGVEGKIGVSFGSYGWSGEAPLMIATKMRQMGMKVLDPVLRIQYKPTEKDLKECLRLGMDIAEKVKNP
jgi:flavodoxin I